MRLRHIEIFQAVLEAGTLTGAAAVLNISQPAATKLLQQAERQAGFPLFSRVLGRLELTVEGRALRDRVEKVTDDLRDIQRLAANLRRSTVHPLRVMGTPTLASALFPRSITRVRKRYPDATIELVTQHSRELVDAIVLREADVGLTLNEFHHPGIQQAIIASGKLRAIAPPGWWQPSELQTPLPLAALAGVPMIGISTTDGLGRALRAQLQYIDPRPEIVIRAHTYQLARSMVARGLGVTVVDPFTAFDHDDGAVQVRELDTDYVVDLWSMMRKGHEPTPIQQHFLEQVRQLAELQSGHAA